MTRFLIEGRVALVTGGSAGIGRELVRLLLEAGAARVLIVGRDLERLAEAKRAFGPRVTSLHADLSNAADVDRLITELPALAPELSLVVNNAGTQLLSDFTASDAAALLPRLRTEIAANFISVVALSVGLLPLLAKAPSAAIVNVTSGLALAPKTTSPVYCATKAGTRSFTRALRYQCEDALPHVRIVEALPPLVDTAMTTGRGSGKMSAADCAAEIVAGLNAGATEIYVGKAKLLRIIMRIAPSIGYAIMRRG